jgi:hypothetical protein
VLQGDADSVLAANRKQGQLLACKFGILLAFDYVYKTLLFPFFFT